jgi:hypothetical protein
MKTHNDHWKNSHFPVLTSLEMHPPVSVRATFTHARSIHYNIEKRSTKGNWLANDIDRVSRQSLKMEAILAPESWHVQSLHTISRPPDEIHQQKLAHCIWNRLVDNPFQ